eukprot:CAMPEP_0194196926 /NCGR_PEP_ID=MMETSP0154-20130528/76930_1 /TAXON_ID=1049557 /ORGANISM="Thalassiothrix antarctica, Strain L6-D1" /LENGTH=107 /DNA_ID=CAMNT_0038921559 /DNA_START=788 /DNA_END=1108 /DNA_ORIENTATION=-
MDKIDVSDKFDFISPYPDVYYEYDDNTGYCGRYTIVFYGIKATSGFMKLVSIVFPMILIACINTLNVGNEFKEIAKNHMEDNCQKGVDPTGYLQVTSALALAAIFIL